MNKSRVTTCRTADSLPSVRREDSVSSSRSLSRPAFVAGLRKTTASFFDTVRSKEHDQASVAPAPVLPDAESMKEQMRKEMCKPKYNVSMYYHKTGFTQWIARNHWFDQLTQIVIGLNALWIWVDTDHNPAATLLNSPPVFQIVENFFCIYFTFEWSMRFGAFERKCNGLRDSWFVFDSMLVATMVFETWLMTAFLIFTSSDKGGAVGIGNTGLLRIARLLRLTRVARMARLSRAAPELLILVKGMIAAMRSVWLTLGLVCVIIYIFAIAFVQLCHDSPCDTIFPHVIAAMHELLLNCALTDDLSNLALPLKEQSTFLLFILYVFYFLSALLLMNMLIAVICQVVAAVAATEHEALALSFVHENIHKLLCETGADKDNDQRISKTEFMDLLVNPKAIAILQDVGVDVVGLVDFKDTLFEHDAYKANMEGDDDEDDNVEVVQADEKKLTFSDLMGLVLSLRGGNAATVRDIVNLRKHIDGRISPIEKTFARFSRPQSVCGIQQTVAASSRPTTPLHGICPSIPEEQDAESSYDSMNPCSSARLGSSPGFRDMFNSLQDIMSALEMQVVQVESENRQLKEQVAQMAGDGCRSSLAKACAICKGLVATPNMETLILPHAIQPPDGSPDFWTEQFHSSSATCTAANRSATSSVEQEVDVDTANPAVDADSAAGGSSACFSQSFPGSQRLVPQPRTEACAATRKVVAASLMARTVVTESVEGPW